MVTGVQGPLAVIKRPGREVDHKPICSVDVKNEWSYTSTHPVCLHGVEREKFAFTLIFQ